MSLVLGSTLAGLEKPRSSAAKPTRRRGSTKTCSVSSPTLRNSAPLRWRSSRTTMTIKTADDMRNAQVRRIDSAVNGAVPQARLDKLNAAYGDGSALTQDDVLPKSWTSTGNSVTPRWLDPDKAAIKTGDIDRRLRQRWARVLNWRR